MSGGTAVKFLLGGYIAHFRKPFTNSSSLSYIFPPRTTVVGMIAALLGRPRDSYYDLLSKEDEIIMLRVLRPPRKLITTVNYLYMKKGGKDSLGDRTQIPLELLVSLDDPFVYEVYYSGSMAGDLVNVLAKGGKLPVALGPAYALGFLEGIGVVNLREARCGGETSTIIPVEMFEGVLPGTEIVREGVVPRVLNEKRELLEVRDYVIPLKGAVKMRSEGRCYEVEGLGLAAPI